MKTLHALLVASSIGLSTSAQSPSRTPDNWGPTKDGVRVSLSLDKFAFAVGEDIPLHIAAQVVAAKRSVYGEPDRPSGAFFRPWDFSRAFHLTITDENDLIVGNNAPSNLLFIISGSSGPEVCRFRWRLAASTRSKYLRTGSRNCCRHSLEPIALLSRGVPTRRPSRLVTNKGTPDSEESRPFVAVSSVPITIHVTANP
jgi:hypothetical protein